MLQVMAETVFEGQHENPGDGVAPLAWGQVRLRTFTRGSSREIFGAVRRVLSFIFGRSDMVHGIPHGAPFGIPTWEATSHVGLPSEILLWQSHNPILSMVLLHGIPWMGLQK